MTCIIDSYLLLLFKVLIKVKEVIGLINKLHKVLIKKKPRMLYFLVSKFFFSKIIKRSLHF